MSLIAHRSKFSLHLSFKRPLASTSPFPRISGRGLHMPDAEDDAYCASLHRVFLAACSTLLAYLVWLPIPDKEPEHEPRTQTHRAEPEPIEAQPASPETLFDASNSG
ncbi:hypothetical protein BDZ97DRAFT_1934744 [Flammula alnicola]|nr:hypothetical protein BDZ97DRAFT_1934744 [Flammula alnicola]